MKAKVFWDKFPQLNCDEFLTGELIIGDPIPINIDIPLILGCPVDIELGSYVGKTITLNLPEYGAVTGTLWKMPDDKSGVSNWRLITNLA